MQRKPEIENRAEPFHGHPIYVLWKRREGLERRSRWLRYRRFFLELEEQSKPDFLTACGYPQGWVQRRSKAVSRVGQALIDYLRHLGSLSHLHEVDSFQNWPQDLNPEREEISDFIANLLHRFFERDGSLCLLQVEEAFVLFAAGSLRLPEVPDPRAWVPDGPQFLSFAALALWQMECESQPELLWERCLPLWVRASAVYLQRGRYGMRSWHDYGRPAPLALPEFADPTLLLKDLPGDYPRSPKAELAMLCRQAFHADYRPDGPFSGLGPRQEQAELRDQRLGVQMDRALRNS
ncbi:MAG: hypothetical protein DWQ01_02350 [Planctomycetota bacterium]|nr:MAG: hypothetical protein DWQ01_02350 [Planctomycetota bacterium]